MEGNGNNKQNFSVGGKTRLAGEKGQTQNPTDTFINRRIARKLLISFFHDGENRCEFHFFFAFDLNFSKISGVLHALEFSSLYHKIPTKHVRIFALTGDTV